jgi:cation transport ATPase
MNRFVFLGLLAINLYFSVTSHAEEGTDDLLRRMEIQNRESQQRLEKSRLEWQQLENEWLRSNAELQRGNTELERLRAETERLRMLNEADEVARKQKELADRAEQAAQEQEEAAQEAEEAAQRAEEAAEQMRNHILQAKIKHKNQIFLGIVFLTILIFLCSVIKKYRKEGYMKDFEKFGIVTVLASGLLILLVLMISEPWVERFDFIQNLMTVLEVHLFRKDELCLYSCEYFISFPAKYAVLALMALAAYGFTTYLGITPHLKRKINSESEKLKKAPH